MCIRRCCGRRIYCWFCCFYCIILTIILASFIFWLIFLPQELKFTATDASLAQFNLSTADNSTLSYDLALNITIRNPNKRVGVYFDRVQVAAKYRKKRFATVTLNSTTPFYQGHKNTTVLRAVLRGQQVLSFKERDVEQYNSENSSGVFRIDVKIALRLRVRFGKIKTFHFKPPKIDCNKLKIPLIGGSSTASNGTFVSASFKLRKCKNVYILTSKGDGGSSTTTVRGSIRFQTTHP